jgi:hypothetical protein
VDVGEGMRVLVAVGVVGGSDVGVCGFVGVGSIPAWVMPQAIENASREVNRRRDRLVCTFILQSE